jgi:hypothetical protein
VPSAGNPVAVNKPFEGFSHLRQGNSTEVIAAKVQQQEAILPSTVSVKP